MKKIFFLIIFFLPLICSAQNYIGVSRADMEASLKRANVKYESSPVVLQEKYIQYQDGASVVKLFFESDTVAYFKVWQSIYNEKKEKFDGYITTVQKIK